MRPSKGGNQQLVKQQYPAAIIEYRRAVQADPRMGPARLQLAQTYASTGDGRDALREYARAAELMPETMRLKSRGVAPKA